MTLRIDQESELRSQPVLMKTVAFRAVSIVLPGGWFGELRARRGGCGCFRQRIERLRLQETGIVANRGSVYDLQQVSKKRMALEVELANLPKRAEAEMRQELERAAAQ